MPLNFTQRFNADRLRLYTAVSLLIPAGGTAYALTATPLPLATRILLGAAGLLTIVALLLFDRWNLRRCDGAQSLRILFGNMLGIVFFLLPFSLKADPGTWSNTILDLFCYAGTIVFVAFSLAARIEPLLATTNFSRVTAFLFPAALAGYGLVLGWQLIALYNAYGMEWSDIAFEFAPFWQSLRTEPFRMIDIMSYESNLLRFHWTPIYLLLAPVTFLWNDPRSILVLSTIFFVAAAYITSLLALHHTASRSVSRWMGIAFLLYLPVHTAHLNDFHADPLALPFILLSFLLAARRQWTGYFLAMALALLCKEYVGLVYFGFGIYLMRQHRMAGAVTSVVGIAWLVFVLKVGIPMYAQGGHQYALDMNYGAIGGAGGLTGMAAHALTHPGDILSILLRQQNVVSLTMLFLPFAFLPFARPLVLLAGGLIVLKNALSPAGIELLAHRESLFLPFVVYAVILYVSDISDAARRRFVLAAMTVTLCATFLLQGHAFPARCFWIEKDRYVKTDHERLIDAMIRKIPADAPVMASSHLAPHLLTRKWYFLFPHFPTPVEPEYVIVDTIGQKEWDWYPRSLQRKGLERLGEEGNYRLLEHHEGLFLFEREKY